MSASTASLDHFGASNGVAVPKHGMPNDVARRARIMIVDDSMIARSIIDRILREDGRFDIVDSVDSAQNALKSLHLSAIDIIMLDVEMPGLSGLDAMPLLMQTAKEAQIFILSSVCESGGKSAIRALAQGASGVMSKPGRARISGKFGTELCTALSSIVNWMQPKTESASSYYQAQSDDTKGIVCSVDTLSPDLLPAPMAALAIGGSTGGITALQTILQGLPADFAAPIFVTQHLPNEFLPYFVSELRKYSSGPVFLLEPDIKILANHIYVVPNDAVYSICAHKNHHIAKFSKVTKKHQSHRSDLAEHSIDRMLACVAATYGAGVTAVIVSGMGRDGSDGARHVKHAGGTVIVQDQASSAVWGMPGSIVQASMADAILNPSLIADFIVYKIAQR